LRYQVAPCVARNLAYGGIFGCTDRPGGCTANAAGLNIRAANEAVKFARACPEQFDLTTFAAELMAQGNAILATFDGHELSIAQARIGVGLLYDGANAAAGYVDQLRRPRTSWRVNPARLRGKQNRTAPRWSPLFGGLYQRSSGANVLSRALRPELRVQSGCPSSFPQD